MNNIQKYFDKEKQEIDKKIALHKTLTTTYLTVATVLLTFCSVFGIYVGVSIKDYKKEMLEYSAQFSDKMEEINKLYNEAKKINKNIKDNFNSFKLRSDYLLKSIYERSRLGVIYKKYELDELIKEYEKDQNIMTQYLGKLYAVEIIRIILMNINIMKIYI